MSQSSSVECLWNQLPQNARSPCDRYKHTCCTYDGNVFVLGGRDNSCLRDFWRYNVVCNEWTELTCTGEAAPEELEEHSMVAHEGFLYVFGGMLDSAYTRSRCPLWVFDVAKQKWVHWQGKLSSPQTEMPTNRKGHSAVVLGSAMLVYGGLIDMKGSSQDFWSLDFGEFNEPTCLGPTAGKVYFCLSFTPPICAFTVLVRATDTMAWSPLNGSQQDSLGPGPRHSHSAMAYQSCMYLFGGLKGLREQRDFWKWSSSTHTWSSLKNRSGPSRLIGHSAVAYKDSMLLFGGGESLNSPNNCLWRYNFTSETWGQVATLPGSSPPNKIHHCCAGLGPSYESKVSSTYCSLGLHSRQPDGKLRPFKNKCFPAPLSFLGSEGDIELETFSPKRCYSRKTPPQSSELNNSKEGWVGNDSLLIGDCLTFENKAFRTMCCTDEDLLDEDDGDIAQHLPDVLLVLGGKPCITHRPISMWQMTLTQNSL